MEDLEKSISELKQEFEETKRLIDENYKNMLNVIAEKESELQDVINDAKDKGYKWLSDHSRSFTRKVTKKELEINELKDYAKEYLENSIKKANEVLEKKSNDLKTFFKIKSERVLNFANDTIKKTAETTAALNAKLNVKIVKGMNIEFEKAKKPAKEKYEIYN